MVVQFGISFSSIQKQTPRPSSFDSMVEVYGHSKDVQETSGVLKDLLDKKAQEFWQSSAKLASVGKSV
jgi:hypothetical protein